MTKEELRKKVEVVEKDLKSYTWRELETNGKFAKKDKLSFITDDMLIVGCDIGSETHYIRAIDVRGRKLSYGALDLDQAVARGAAVYHYYLHRFAEMQDDMKLLGNAGSEELRYESNEKMLDNKQEAFSQTTIKHITSNMAIQWGNNILNDSLYLGVKNGAVHKIIPTGAELPFTSDVMTGFKVEPGQSIISIPIKSQNIDGTYRTIANAEHGRSSNIQFSSHAVGVALSKVDSDNSIISVKEETKVVKKLSRLIRTGNLSSEELTCCILALGCICDTRKYASTVDGETIYDALSAIRDADDYNTYLDMTLKNLSS